MLLSYMHLVVTGQVDQQADALRAIWVWRAVAVVLHDKLGTLWLVQLQRHAVAALAVWVAAIHLAILYNLSCLAHLTHLLIAQPPMIISTSQTTNATGIAGIIGPWIP